MISIHVQYARLFLLISEGEILLDNLKICIHVQYGCLFLLISKGEILLEINNVKKNFDRRKGVCLAILIRDMQLYKLL